MLREYIKEYIDKVKRKGILVGSIIMILIILFSRIDSNLDDLKFKILEQRIVNYYEEKYK